MAADDDQNGNTLRWRIGELERNREALEEAAKWIAKMGERHNQQIVALDRDVAELKDAIKEVPVLAEKVDTLVDGWRAVRNAFLAAAGGMILLAASIVWQATA